MHILQISLDTSLLHATVADESLRRQLAYGEELLKRSLGCDAEMTILVLVPDFKSIKRRFGNVTIEAVPKGMRYLWNLYNRLKTIHKANFINVITTQTVYNEAWVALIFKCLWKVPVVGQIHFDIFSTEAKVDCFGSGFKGLIRYRLALKGLKYFTRIRVVGKRIGDQISKRKLQKPNRIYLLPVPVPMLTNASENATLSGRKVLFVGRLVAQKNMELWLKVAQRIVNIVPEAEFDIVGDGNLRSKLECLAQDLGLSKNVRFHGWVKYEELIEIYKSAKVFLLTSHYEGFGRVLVEAMAYSVPCVASKCAGVEDIITHETSGFLYSKDDLPGITAAVCRLLQDDSYAKIVGHAGNVAVRTRFAPNKLITANISELLAAASPDLPFVPPLRRTFKRFATLIKTKASLLRGLQYEKISVIKINGHSLDIGGGAAASYNSLLNGFDALESINIDPKMNPTYIHDLNEPLPFPPLSYDTIISLNTLEHVKKDDLIISEILRILKLGGELHVLVPFIYPVHAAPHDFHRQTAFWWESRLLACGVIPSNIRIEPLVWDRATAALALIESGSTTIRFFRKLIMLCAVFRDSIFEGFGSERLLRTPKHIVTTNFASGYYIYAKKTN